MEKYLEAYGKQAKKSKCLAWGRNNGARLLSTYLTNNIHHHCSVTTRGWEVRSIGKSSKTGRPVWVHSQNFLIVRAVWKEQGDVEIGSSPLVGVFGWHMTRGGFEHWIRVGLETSYGLQEPLTQIGMPPGHPKEITEQQGSGLESGWEDQRVAEWKKG